MKYTASLCWRHFGIHETVRSVSIELADVNDEQKLAAATVAADLKLPPLSKVLLVVDGTGVSNTKMFRPWGKYFDSYALHVDPIKEAT